MTPIDRVVDIAGHMIMPVMSLAAIYLAIYARLVRSSIIEVSPRISSRRRGPGACARRIVVGHMLRNALVPVVTVAGVQVGALVAALSC